MTSDEKQVEVSIILGTVNRPQMLRDCIVAARDSLGALRYEVVVAYGSGDDSSLPWMRTQGDIVPVLGGLNGAIEAFNRAYEASRGCFVCQINDDVLIDGDSIVRAVAYLRRTPEAAGVVFKFNRNDGEGYRYIRFPNGALHPNQMVVRREACEAVAAKIGAFWGDKKHRTDDTYGGDSAFGVVCNHLGLRLDPVEGVTCRDLLVQDVLRSHNVSKIHPKHYERWHAMYDALLTRTV